MKPPPDHEPSASSSASPADTGGPVAGAIDHETLTQAQGGDLRAMEILVEHHRDAIARLLWRFARTPADLDDLVQDTFVRMVRGLPAWRREQPFAHWLLRIATNVGRDYFRRHTVRRRWFADQPATDDANSTPDPVDPAPDPAARVAADEVKTLLAQLPPDERTLLTLHHLEGWPLADIAAQFGWTVTATKLRAWRARRQLRALFENRSLS